MSQTDYWKYRNIQNQNFVKKAAGYFAFSLEQLGNKKIKQTKNLYETYEGTKMEAYLKYNC